jgi:magnesium-transporting ATPase (P-type)
MVYITSGSTPAQGSSQASTAFSITAQELTDIVNKYKERDENMQDINHFTEKGGINYLLEALGTDKTNGISSEENREQHFGSNKVFRKPPPTFWEFVVESLSDKMIIILICCSIFEIGISLFYIFGQDEKDNMDWIDGTSIIIAVFVVVSVGSVTNYKKEMKFHALNDLQNGQTKYNVIRKGQPLSIIADDILVGDLIKINYGEILPADMLMVEGNGIKIDESSLTGESNAVSKKPYEKCREEYEQGNNNPSSMILLSGTNVIEGAGVAIAIAIGEHSQKGIIRGTIDNAQEDNKTPLENKLNDIADLIGYFGLGSAIVTFVALGIQMLVRYLTSSE